MKSLRLVVCLTLVAALVGACTDQGQSQSPSQSQSTSATSPATVLTTPAGPTSAGGCGRSPWWTSGLPDWTASAGAPSGFPFVLSIEGNLVGILFAHPLRAGTNIENPANKILWISREERHGEELRLQLRRTDGTGEPKEQTEFADSSPGEIYPSIVDAPTAGCWSVTATWGPNTATLDLAYV